MCSLLLTFNSGQCSMNRGTKKMLVAQLCPTLCNSIDCSPPGSSVHGGSPGKNTGVGSHSLLQGIFPTQGLNPGLLHGRQILYHLSHELSLARTSSSAFRRAILNVYLRLWHQVRKPSLQRIGYAHITFQTFVLFIYLLLLYYSTLSFHLPQD